MNLPAKVLTAPTRKFALYSKVHTMSQKNKTKQLLKHYKLQ